MSISGLLGRHPLVDDLEQLRSLDAWISSQILLAIRKRQSILQSTISPPFPQPWGFDRKMIGEFFAKSTRGDTVDGRIPSCTRMAELVRRAVRAHGVRVAAHTASAYSWST